MTTKTKKPAANIRRDIFAIKLEQFDGNSCYHFMSYNRDAAHTMLKHYRRECRRYDAYDAKIVHPSKSAVAGFLLVGNVIR